MWPLKSHQFTPFSVMQPDSLHSNGMARPPQTAITWKNMGMARTQHATILSSESCIQPGLAASRGNRRFRDKVHWVHTSFYCKKKDQSWLGPRMVQDNCWSGRRDERIGLLLRDFIRNDGRIRCTMPCHLQSIVNLNVRCVGTHFKAGGHPVCARAIWCHILVTALLNR